MEPFPGEHGFQLNAEQTVGEGAARVTANGTVPSERFAVDELKYENGLA